MNTARQGDPTRILFAGGGTGGHISPGLAIAERLAELDPPVDCVFVCSERAIDASMLSEAQQRFVPIPAVPPTLRPAGAIRFARSYRQSIRMVRDLIAREGITDAVSLGGFVAAPAVTAAHRSGARITLLNLDAVPGKATRLLRRRCDRVWSGIALAEGITMPIDRFVGMPVRRRALAPDDRTACRASLGLDPALLTLLVTGASQGARSINQFMELFIAQSPEALRGWQVLHLAGQGDVDQVRDTYEANGVASLVLPFLHEMGLAWGTADLAISRAGANSVAEVAVNAVPTIFLPYPYHRDGHQRANAAPLETAGGAVIVEDRIDPMANLTGVGEVLRGLLSDDRQQLNAMRAALEAARPGDAALEVARALVDQ